MSNTSFISYDFIISKINKKDTISAQVFVSDVYKTTSNNLTNVEFQSGEIVRRDNMATFVLISSFCKINQKALDVRMALKAFWHSIIMQ